MGLIAQVHNGKNEHGTQKRGDVIVVMLEDSPWGPGDCKHFVRIYLDDPALESRLVAKRAKGQDHPVIAYPYAERDEKGRMTKMSSKSFDIDGISDACVERSGKTRKEIADHTTEIPPLKAGLTQYKFQLSELTAKEISHG